MTASVGVRRAFQADDVLRMAAVGDPRVSPDGTRVAYVVTTSDREADALRSHIWIAPLNGGEPRQLTRGPQRDTSPRWSPDGKTLAFVGNRSGDAKETPAQIWLIGEAGEPWQLTDTVKGASSPAWSPDGKTLLFVTRTRCDGETRRADDRTPVEKNAPRVLRDLVYRFDGEGQYDDTFAHVWTIPAAGGAARQITAGAFNDAEPAWSADGGTIILGSYREDDRGEKRQNDVWAVSVADGAARKLTESKGPCAFLQLSPDGRTVAYAGHDRGEGFSSAPQLVWTVPLAGGEPRSLTAALDRSVTGLPGAAPIAWTPDSRGLLFLAMDAGASRLYRLPAGGGDAEAITGTDFWYTAISLTPNGKAAVCAALSPTNPGELVVQPLDGGPAQQLTHHNDGLVAEVELATYEAVCFKGADGWDIPAWLVKPAGYQAGRSYPFVLEIHGGPHGMHGVTFQPGVHELAGRGYVVLLVNPRGSTGYGERFTEACVGDWGGKDYEDLMAGVDWAVQQGIADPERLLVTGYSYGGFMTSWVVGHTDRFKAAVCGAPVSDLVSFYGESDIGPTFGQFEHRGPVWERWDSYRERSPLNHIANCHTPFLLLHWEGDLRCPIGQSEELFAILKRLRREAEFVRYPGGFHVYTMHGAPSQRADFHRRVGDWFDRHLPHSA